MTLIIALIGHPVGHSLSPSFQQAALDASGIDARYEPWDVPPAELSIAAERLRSGSLLGANITVPHKVEMLRLVDRLDAVAERVGAVNTVIRRDGLLHATNTDVAGLRRALAAAGVDLRGSHAVLIGAGGAARAAVVALREAGAASLTVANRTRERARALADIAGDLPLAVTTLEPGSSELQAAVGDADIVIQATPLGLPGSGAAQRSPIPASFFARGQIAFDLVYGAEPTPFLREASRAGAITIDGLPMLIHQGAESFRLWTGVDPPLDVMFDAARRALAGRLDGSGSRRDT